MAQYSKNYIIPVKLPLKGGGKDKSFWKRRYNKRFRQKTKPEARKK